MFSYLILNAHIVNEGSVSENDLYVKDGRIVKIGADLQSTPADKVVDAKGKHLFPGMIDDQVHFREPGLTHKGSILTESQAAVAGGITSFMDMPNTMPPTLTRERLANKFAIAQKTSLANYSFYLGAGNDTIEEIKALSPGEACGIKVFMGASTGNLLVDDPGTLDAIFRSAPTLVAVHCEDTPTILENERRFRDLYGPDVPMGFHPLIRSEAACFKSSELAVSLARRHGTRLHVLHLSTARELDLFSHKPLEDKHITAEVCVHHLFFDEADYAGKGALIKCNPAIKTKADREALLRGVQEGRIDIIGTDHAPHKMDEKMKPYFQAPSGLPLARHALMCLLEHYHARTFSLPLIAEKTAHAPSRLFQIVDRGYIREGYFADLVLVDLNRPFVVDDHPVFYGCGWSPFSERVFSSTVESVWVSGHLAYHEDRIDDSQHGMRLAFDR